MKDGKTEIEAEAILKDTDSGQKNELLFSKYGVNYNQLDAIFRKGSVIYRDKVPSTEVSAKTGLEVVRLRPAIVVNHCDLIGKEFWEKNANIL